MTGKLSKNFHGVGIGPLSNILAVKYILFNYFVYFAGAERICKDLKMCKSTVF